MTMFEVLVWSVLFMIYCQCTATGQEILLSQILYRHGDRTPYESFPTNPVPPSAWSEGYQQLTVKGMRQQYKLGQYLRSRYVKGQPYKLLNDTYMRNEIFIQSTDYDRTLMSAYCNLAGMYPPDDTHRWSADLKWQPIPVHTQPLDTDYMLHMEVKCPAYDRYLQDVLNSETVKEEEAKNKLFYEYLENSTGLTNENITLAWKVYDTLFCQEQNGYKLPSWAYKIWTEDGKTTYEKLAWMYGYNLDLQMNHPGEKRLRGGPLLGRMIENMKAKLSGTLSPPERKLFVYSAHDDTIVALLSALNVHNGLTPQYTATVMIDLVSEGSTHYVHVLYKNDTQRGPYLLHISGCASVNCTFEELVSVTHDNVPINWWQECHVMPSYHAIGGPLMVGKILLPFACLLLMVLVYIAFVTGVKRRTTRNYDTISSDFDNMSLNR